MQWIILFPLAGRLVGPPAMGRWSWAITDGFGQYLKHQSHLPSETGDDEASWPQQCGSTGQRVTLRTLWIQRKGGARQKGGKDKSMKCWGQTDTADIKAAMLGRGRKKRKGVFNKDTRSNKIPPERKEYLEITQGFSAFTALSLEQIYSSQPCINELVN